MDDAFPRLSSKLWVFTTAGRGVNLSKLVLMFELEDSETRVRAEEDAVMIKRMI